MNAALKKAYDLEKKGLEFYIDMAVKIKNALARRTLFYLAEEEIKHMMKIDDVVAALDKEGKWPQAEVGPQFSDIEISLKAFFEKTGKAAFAENRDNAWMISKAMEFERASYEFYAELANKAGSENEKRFYAELKAQEEEHYEALENVYHYLTDTGDWFGKEESRVWNWMNL